MLLFTLSHSTYTFNLLSSKPYSGWGEGGKKALPTSFSPATFINVGISPQNFLTFSLNAFATLV